MDDIFLNTLTFYKIMYIKGTIIKVDILITYTFGYLNNLMQE